MICMSVHNISEKCKIYCKTFYFCCILILSFQNVEILLHFYFMFSQSSTGIYQAVDGQTE